MLLELGYVPGNHPCAIIKKVSFGSVKMREAISSLVTSGEEANAVPVALFRLRVRTLLGDGLGDSVRVNDLRVQKERCQHMGSMRMRVERVDATGKGEGTDHAGPWGISTDFCEDNVADVVDLVLDLLCLTFVSLLGHV